MISGDPLKPGMGQDRSEILDRSVIGVLVSGDNERRDLHPGDSSSAVSTNVSRMRISATGSAPTCLT